MPTPGSPPPRKAQVRVCTGTANRAPARGRTTTQLRTLCATPLPNATRPWLEGPRFLAPPRPVVLSHKRFTAFHSGTVARHASEEPRRRLAPTRSTTARPPLRHHVNIAPVRPYFAPDPELRIPLRERSNQGRNKLWGHQPKSLQARSGTGRNVTPAAMPIPYQVGAGSSEDRLQAGGGCGLDDFATQGTRGRSSGPLLAAALAVKPRFAFLEADMRCSFQTMPAVYAIEHTLCGII
jgi:hypothetical protein